MANVDEENQEEMMLAQKLKEKYCNKLGVETNSAKAAKILHQIGIIYRKRSPDKISLIKSAGLFNAAIIRNPSNVCEIKSDLTELCQHVLQISNANKQNANLIKKGKEVKDSFTEMRKKVKEFLDTNLPHIPQKVVRKFLEKLNSAKIAKIRQINKTIAETYQEIMSKLSYYCKT